MGNLLATTDANSCHLCVRSHILSRGMHAFQYSDQVLLSQAGKARHIKVQRTVPGHGENTQPLVSALLHTPPIHSFS